MKNLKPGTSAFPWVSIEWSARKAEAFMKSCRGMTYGYGKKAPFRGAKPMKDYLEIDCSGFVREFLWATSPETARVDIVDGSYNQHQQIKNAGFKKSTVDDAKRKDGVLRIAFLSPQDGTGGVGHVALIYNGKTYESCGSMGPCRRVWTAKGWQAKCSIYVLRPYIPEGSVPEVAGGAK